ncbi:MAG: hypothetical protein KGJ86_00670 [Chloroflexota bacterium]|nr:hypothetical protein [Chloroflexota bacterium]
MSQDPLTLDSGAVLTVQIAPFEAGHRLFQVFLREMKSASPDATLDDTLLGMHLFQSPALAEALAVCTQRCLYNGQRITASTWEPEAAREDYLPASMKVLEANLRPFVKSLRSRSSEAGSETTSSSPRSA